MKIISKKKFLLLTFFVGYNVISQVANYNLGDVVDDFTVTDIKGNEWNLYDITSQGKFVYLDFFFADCVPCQLTQATFNEVYDKYGCNSGALFLISINRGTETNAEVVAYENEFGGTFNHSPAVGIEGGCEAVDLNFGINGYPSYLLISPENVYLFRIEEFIGDITVEAFEDSFPSDFNPEPMPCNLAIDENVNTFDFKIYPNPTSGNVSINLDRNVGEVSVRMYNVLGQEIYSQAFTQNSFVLTPNFSRGTYFVVIQSSYGLLTKKLIVE